MKRPGTLRHVAFALVLASVLVAFAVRSAPPAITGPSKGVAAAGKKIFSLKCVPCHKADGSGGFKLTGNPTPDWPEAKRMPDPKSNDEYLRDCITNGKMKSGMLARAQESFKPA